jgi:hypothetical protein
VLAADSCAETSYALLQSSTNSSFRRIFQEWLNTTKGAAPLLLKPWLAAPQTQEQMQGTHKNRQVASKAMSA